MHHLSVSHSSIRSIHHPVSSIPSSRESLPFDRSLRNTRNTTAVETLSQPALAAEFRNEQYDQKNPFDLDCYEMNEVEREELEFLARFIQDTAFYAETLEEYLGEPLDDFWESREHAYHIITTYLLLNLDTRVAYDEE
jgi:hypothetical protein